MVRNQKSGSRGLRLNVRPLDRLPEVLYAAVNLSMPIISTFFGIVVRMFYREHEPPHFHGEYQGQQGKFNFDGKMISGEIGSKTARRLIKQWASVHRDKLEGNWKKMKEGRTLEKIAPLE